MLIILLIIIDKSFSGYLVDENDIKFYINTHINWDHIITPSQVDGIIANLYKSVPVNYSNSLAHCLSKLREFITEQL